MRLIPANRNRSRSCIPTLGQADAPSAPTTLGQPRVSVERPIRSSLNIQMKNYSKKSQPSALPVNQMQVTVD
jgi:hypothetical protein